MVRGRADSGWTIGALFVLGAPGISPANRTLNEVLGGGVALEPSDASGGGKGLKHAAHHAHRATGHENEAKWDAADLLLAAARV